MLRLRGPGAHVDCSAGVPSPRRRRVVENAISIDYAELLAHVELFAGLDRVALAQLTAHVDPLAVEDGVALYSQGDVADAVFIVAQGSLGIYVSTVDHSGETRVNLISARDCIGEM